MTISSSHPHAEFDRFPMLVESVRQQFNDDGLMSNVERFIDAEGADFHWDGRNAEHKIGLFESLDDDAESAFERVDIIGYFRARYYVAACILDAERCVRATVRLRQFDGFEDAEEVFLGGSG